MHCACGTGARSDDGVGNRQTCVTLRAARIPRGFLLDKQSMLASVAEFLRSVARGSALGVFGITILGLMIHPGGSHWGMQKEIAALMISVVGGIGALLSFVICTISSFISTPSERPIG